MTGIISQPHSEIDDLNRLHSLSKEKQEEHKQPHKNTSQVDTAYLAYFTELKHVLDTMLELKKSLTHVELNQLGIKRDWEKFSHDITEQLGKYRSENEHIISEFRKVNEERLKVIKEQEAALSSFRKASLLSIIKNFLKPRIGKLYQYEPRPLKLPKHYKNTIKLKETPTVSIVTPSLNQGYFLERTICSVSNQNYPALEYIIQDGGSVDDTLDVIKRYKSSIKHWESCKDEGQSHAINLGFRHATGEIMAYLNSDDILLPGTLAYVVDYFNKHPDVDVVYGHRILIDEHEHEIGRWVLPAHDSNVLTWADFIPQETLFWRKRIWEKIGGEIDESFRFAMDWDLLLRFREAGAKFVRLPRFLGAFRVHLLQKTSSTMTDVGAKEMHRLRVRAHGRFVSAYEIRQRLRPYLLKHVLYDRFYTLGILRY